MCTAISLQTKGHYFGRNLDLECSYGEAVCVVPRRFPLEFRRMGKREDHYAIIGMATMVEGTPLFYDGVNEHGLAMAGLNFPGNAYYGPEEEGRENVSPFEFIPWILSQCKNLVQARRLLENIHLANIPFGENLPLSPLHWMLAYEGECLVVEAMSDGLHIREDPACVLTNNPPLNYQLFNLNNYRAISTSNGENRFGESLKLEEYCQGLGGLGLPGDVSSMSRFVRAAFAKANAVCQEDEASSVGQFFHLLDWVQMPRGICRTPSGSWDITVYSACMNTRRGLYYYTTYDNRQISCVDLHRIDLQGREVVRFPLILSQQICRQN